MKQRVKTQFLMRHLFKRENDESRSPKKKLVKPTGGRLSINSYPTKAELLRRLFLDFQKLTNNGRKIFRPLLLYMLLTET